MRPPPEPNGAQRKKAKPAATSASEANASRCLGIKPPAVFALNPAGPVEPVGADAPFVYVPLVGIPRLPVPAGVDESVVACAPPEPSVAVAVTRVRPG